MNLPRRAFLRLTAGAAALPALPRFVRVRPIRAGRCISLLDLPPEALRTFSPASSARGFRNDWVNRSSSKTTAAQAARWGRG